VSALQHNLYGGTRNRVPQSQYIATLADSVLFEHVLIELL